MHNTAAVTSNSNTVGLMGVEFHLAEEQLIVSLPVWEAAAV
jgi:hypothetical protein